MPNVTGTFSGTGLHGQMRANPHRKSVGWAEEESPQVLTSESEGSGQIMYGGSVHQLH